MQILKIDYDFYELPEKQRKAMVGDFFVEKADLDRLGEDLVCRYYPIQLSEDEKWYNYGVQQGILRLSTFWPHFEYKQGKRIETGKEWFKVSCFSPDDLDLCLHWTPAVRELRPKVIELITEMPKDGVGYRECLEFIQSFYGGEIGM
jgi:hypothetical protein